MSKQGSVAPKERISIKYVPATGDQTAEMELPHKLLVVGDYKGKALDTPIGDREAVSVNKNNFESVLRESGLSFQACVADRLQEEENAELNVSLDFRSLADFSPDNVVKKVPELNKLMELREALVALKGPMGNVPAFRKSLEQLISDDEVREALLSELLQLDIRPED